MSTCERTKGSLAPCLVAVWSLDGLLETQPRWHATIYIGIDNIDISAHMHLEERMRNSAPGVLLLEIAPFF